MRNISIIRTLLPVIFLTLGYSAPAWASDPYNMQSYFVNYGAPIAPKKMQLNEPVTKRLCVLSGYAGQGSGAKIYIGPANSWALELLKPASPDSRASATCFDISAFSYPYGNAHWISNNFKITAAKPGTGLGTCQTTTLDAWWSDAATILQGVSGVGAALQEAAFIDQQLLQQNVSSKVAATACTHDVTAYANSFFVGAPSSGQLAKFYVGAGSTSSGEYYLKINMSLKKTNAVAMAPVDAAMCYFTAIGGTFGAWLDDEVNISPNGPNDSWLLQVHSEQSGDGYLWAKARCLLRKQPKPAGVSPHQQCLTSLSG